MNIGFVGTGVIAEAMVQGLAGQGHAIALSDRNAATAARLASTVPGVTVHDNQSVLDRSEIVILCLMADVARTVLPGLAFRDTQQVISVMVDVPHAQLEKLCAPATDIAITIPLPSVAVGGCPLPVFPDASAVAALFGAANPVFAVSSEAALNAHFAATALLSVATDQMRVVAEWLAGFTGDPAVSEGYVVALAQSHLATLAPQDGLQKALAQLATEGGLNATLRQRVADAGALDALRAGLDGFRSRLGLD